MQPPKLKIGQIVKAEIEAIGKEGDGIAKIDGYALIIPNTKKGEFVAIKVTKLLKKYGFAERVVDSNKENGHAGV